MSERISISKGAAAVQVAALAGLLETHGVDPSALLSRVCPLALWMAAGTQALLWPAVHLPCACLRLLGTWGALCLESARQVGWSRHVFMHEGQCIAERAWRGPLSQCFGCAGLMWGRLVRCRAC